MHRDLRRQSGIWRGRSRLQRSVVDEEEWTPARPDIVQNSVFQRTPPYPPAAWQMYSPCGICETDICGIYFETTMRAVEPLLARGARQFERLKRLVSVDHRTAGDAVTAAAISCHGLVVSAAKLDENERTTGQTQKQASTADANLQYLRALYLAQLAGPLSNDRSLDHRRHRAE